MDFLKQTVDFLSTMAGYASDLFSWCGNIITTLSKSGNDLWNIFSGIMETLAGLL